MNQWQCQCGFICKRPIAIKTGELGKSPVSGRGTPVYETLSLLVNGSHAEMFGCPRCGTVIIRWAGAAVLPNRGEPDDNDNPLLSV